jgi:two-component system, cell cycle sensor histidine kinase and response regulator CckA
VSSDPIARPRNTPPGDRWGAAEASASPRTDGARRHILVVDDEHVVLAITSRMLRSAGYGAVEAPSARQALGILEQGDPPVDLVITDVVMPETDGRTLGRLIAERFPGLPVAYMSAYPVNDVFHRGAPGPNLPFLSKPFSPEALLALVKSVLVP